MAAAEIIRIICPNLKCRTVLSVPSSARGKSVRCRSCGSRVSVPASKSPAPRAKSSEVIGPEDTAAA